MLKAGDKVTWTSQSGGSTKRKTGILLGSVEAKESGFAALNQFKGNELFASENRSKIKFQDTNIVYNRAIVEVPRGGKSVLSDYYAPSVTLVRLV